MLTKNSDFKLANRKCKKQGDLHCESCFSGFMFNKQPIQMSTGEIIPPNKICVPVNQKKPNLQQKRPNIQLSNQRKMVKGTYRTAKIKEDDYESKKYKLLLQLNRP